MWNYIFCVTSLIRTRYWLWRGTRSGCPRRQSACTSHGTIPRSTRWPFSVSSCLRQGVPPSADCDISLLHDGHAWASIADGRIASTAGLRRRHGPTAALTQTSGLTRTSTHPAWCILLHPLHHNDVDENVHLALMLEIPFVHMPFHSSCTVLLTAIVSHR